MYLAEHEYFPEEAIVWPNITEVEKNDTNYQEAVAQDAESDTSTSSVVLAKITNPNSEEAVAQEAKSGAYSPIASTIITIPNSEEDFGDYERGLPLPWFRPLDSVYSERPSEADKTRTCNFYRCLGYRFGQTMRDLKEEHEKNMEALKCPKRRGANRRFLWEALKYWRDDYLKRPPVTPMYRDIIKRAAPAQWNKKWNPRSVEDGESEAAELVRKGILEEAYENKNPLWPTENYIDEDGNDTGQPRPAAIWGFAHPSIKPKVKQFFDINRWPKELQTPERIREIEASGPTQPHPDDCPKAEVPQAPIPFPEDPEVRWTYSDIYEGRKTFHDGKFWIGDTPRQRKYVINRIRRSK